MVASNKRKCNNDSSKGFSVVVVGDNDSSVDDLKEYLQFQKNRYHGDDSLLCVVEDINESRSSNQTCMLKKSRDISLQISSQTSAARDACDEESIVLQHLADVIENTRCKQSSLLNELHNLDDRLVTLQQLISNHQDESSRKIEAIDIVEEERKKQVPRLKTQISLFASTTGIKWDFSQAEILSGSMAVPNEMGLKLFSIDPSAQTSVETASMLWGMMDGDT